VHSRTPQLNTSCDVHSLSLANLCAARPDVHFGAIVRRPDTVGRLTERRARANVFTSEDGRRRAQRDGAWRHQTQLVNQ